MKDIWHQSGLSDGGVDLNKWIRADIPIVFEASSVDPGDQKLVFEATVGDKNLGNIAIDDVTFTPGCKYESKLHSFAESNEFLSNRFFEFGTTTPMSTSTTTKTSSTSSSQTTKTTVRTTVTSTKTTPHQSPETTRTTPTTPKTTTSQVVSAPPSNPNSNYILIVSIIVGVFIVIAIVVTVIITVRYRYHVPSLARLQSFLNPNYQRFDDNNMVRFF